MEIKADGVGTPKASRKRKRSSVERFVTKLGDTCGHSSSEWEPSDSDRDSDGSASTSSSESGDEEDEDEVAALRLSDAEFETASNIPQDNSRKRGSERNNKVQGLTVGQVATNRRLLVAYIRVLQCPTHRTASASASAPLSAALTILMISRCLMVVCLRNQTWRESDWCLTL